MQMSHQSDSSLLDISDGLSLSLVIRTDLLFLLPSTNDAVHYVLGLDCMYPSLVE